MVNSDMAISRARKPASRLAIAARLLAGAALLIGAALKSQELLTTPLAENGLTSNRWFWIAIVEYEWVLGMLLVSRIVPRRVWIVAVGTFVVFIAYVAYLSWLGESSCGCFGKVKIDPRLTLLADIAIVSALLFGGPDVSSRPGALTMPNPAIFMLALIVGVPLAWMINKVQRESHGESADLLGSGAFVVMEPEKWIGKAMPLIPHIDIGKQLSTGKWLVVVYDHTCSHCLAAMPAYSRLAGELADQSSTARLALIELPPYGTTATQAPPLCVMGRLSSSKDWFAQTPVELLLDNGVVLFARDKGDGLSWFDPRPIK